MKVIPYTDPLKGMTITWIARSYPIYVDDTYTDFYDNPIYETGTIVYTSKCFIIVEIDKGSDGIKRKRFYRSELIQKVEDKALKQLIIDSTPTPSEPRNKSALHTVYSLSDPRNGHTHYVGISKNMDLRYRQHCQCQGLNLELNIWIQDLLRLGLTPKLDVLEIVTGSQVAQERESYWIQHYTSQDAPLKNIAKVDREIAS